MTEPARTSKPPHPALLALENAAFDDEPVSEETAREIALARADVSEHGEPEQIKILRS